MSARIPYGQNWSADGKTGRSAAKFFRCNIVLNVEDSAVIDRRYSYFGGAADV